MTYLQRYSLTASVVLLPFLGVMNCFADSGPKNLVEIESGTAAFEASTNMPGIEVKGKSSALSGRVEVVQDGNGLVLQRIEASLPVNTLATGMKVRDEHMRKYIFTNEGGQAPDLHFAADLASCPAPASASQFTCQISGNLSIRGVARPVEIRLRVKQQQGAATAFRVEGDGLVKMSDYGIAAPSQFGVKPANEVKFHLEFTGRQKSLISAAGGASR